LTRVFFFLPFSVKLFSRQRLLWLPPLLPGLVLGSEPPLELLLPGLLLLLLLLLLAGLPLLLLLLELLLESLLPLEFLLPVGKTLPPERGLLLVSLLPLPLPGELPALLLGLLLAELKTVGSRSILGKETPDGSSQTSTQTLNKPSSIQHINTKRTFYNRQLRGKSFTENDSENPFIK
jgi:hypothetical protein